MPPTAPLARHVVVLGLMGAGKSGISRRVAAALGWPRVDGDDELEARYGATAAGIAERDGIDELHRLEAGILLDALVSDDRTVIAPAASTVEDDRCRAALAERATVVWLTAPPEFHADRAATKDHRPLVGAGDDVALFRRQQATREPLILPLAALVIDVREVGKDDAAARIVELVTRAAAPPSSSPPS